MYWLTCDLQYMCQDVLHHFKGWTLSESQEIGPVTNEGSAPCVEKADEGWEFLDSASNSWKADPSLSFECVELAECCSEVRAKSASFVDRYSS